jgi:hypothetical protein
MRYVSTFSAAVFAFVAATCFSMGISFAGDAHITTAFKGVKANTGYATLAKQGNTTILTWSDEFKIPDTPAPHWQVVDSKGNVYLLNRLVIKGDKQNRTIAVPSYVKDVAKVQIWCAYAEVLLGESSFDKPVMTAAGESQMMMSSTR